MTCLIIPALFLSFNFILLNLQTIKPMRFLTLEDIKDVFIKLHQRGPNFLLSKLKITPYARTISAFNEEKIDSANFWIIPEVRRRWNRLITGHSDIGYEAFLSANYFQNTKEFKVLALGSGDCSHELLLAELNPHWQIDCFDFCEKRLNSAIKTAKDKKLNNIFFYLENIVTYNFDSQKYNAVFFHASLHHFDKILHFLKHTVIHSLKPKGYLIINEYVGKNRLQYSKEQIKQINKALQSIPKEYRKIYKTRYYKNHYYGNGIFKMIIADPSECVDSESILPAIYTHFDIVLEKPYGNNLLHSTLKDIAHHFIENDNYTADKQQVLQNLFKMEDNFLQSNPSDYVFGIYQLKNKE
ncbi:MAG: methyltransferase domain-containing protein [Flavobacterium sp.]|nr:methyltransferase domain-containing protein [Flavobacterium sp.]